MLSKAENSLKRFGEFYPHYDYALPYQTHARGVFSLNNAYKSMGKSRSKQEE